jgi:hypothetical protein
MPIDPNDSPPPRPRWPRYERFAIAAAREMPGEPVFRETITCVTAVSGDFELTMDELRAVSRFAAESAQVVLSAFEDAQPGDSCPRAAIGAAWEFANGAAAERVVVIVRRRPARRHGDHPALAVRVGSGGAVDGLRGHVAVRVVGVGLGLGAVRGHGRDLVHRRVRTQLLAEPLPLLPEALLPEPLLAVGG